MVERRLSLLQAVSLNMSMMVGTGIFITLPTLMGTMNGPMSMIGWVLGGLIALADGMVWSELAAAFPGSGGTYHFFDAAYGQARVGRLLKFLFVWQFFFSGPLEIATGAIGMVKYLGYFIPVLRLTAWNWRAYPSRSRRSGRMGPGWRNGRDGARDGARLSSDLGRGKTDGRALGGNVDHGGLGHRGWSNPLECRLSLLIPPTGTSTSIIAWPWVWEWRSRSRCTTISAITRCATWQTKLRPRRGRFRARF